MEFTEQQVYEALGLGEQAQEVAAPAEQASDVSAEALADGQGEQAQEPAAPAQAATVENEGASAGDSAEEAPAEDGEESESGAMTAEQRRANAARRRQQEQQAAIDRAVNEALEQERNKNAAAMQDFFAKAGLKNTVTGQPITSMEEFHAWNEQYARAKLEKELKDGKLTAEGLSTAIGSHPIVKQAQQLIDQEEATKRGRQEEAVKARIDAEIAEIHKIDASINSLEDLLRAPYGQDLYAMTKRGYSIKDAHYLLNHERLEAAKMEAARQQGIASARSKDHLTATGTPRGGGLTSVPAGDLAMFRQFNPGASDAEIQAYYNKYMKR